MTKNDDEWYNLGILLPCELCWHGISCHRVSVCPSDRLTVCPPDTSWSCTKMAKPRITITTPYDSRGTLVFLRQKHRRNSNDISPTGAPNRGGVGSHRGFSTNLAISQKWCKVGTYFLRKANRNSYALYQMTLF